jgi:heme/copper-type cytochrome/quinol oxidase subunit 2
MIDYKNPWIERRRGPDFWIKFVKGTIFIVWIALLASLVIFAFSQPLRENMISRAIGEVSRTYWDLNTLIYVVYVFIVQLIISFIALMINLRRNRRKSDSISKSHIFVSIMSIIGIIIYLVISG